MTEDLEVKALSIKKNGELTSLESQQIKDLRKAYGMNNAISAIRFAKSASIHDVARMLLQHCGVRTVLPPSIKDVVPDKALAEKSWTHDKFQIAIRLASATISMEKEINQLVDPLLLLWESNITQSKLTDAIKFAIIGSVKKYGEPLAQRGIQSIPPNTSLPEEQLIKLYKEWLKCASEKDWSGVENILKEFGNFSALATSGMPAPISIRLNKYFTAKANRNPTEEEMSTLWLMLKEHTVEEIIHAMSCIPTVEFSIYKVRKILTPKEFWEFYEFNVEEGITTLFQKQLGRAPTKEEEKAYLDLHEKAKIESYDFFDLAYRSQPGQIPSISEMENLISIKEQEINESLDENFPDKDD